MRINTFRGLFCYVILFGMLLSYMNIVVVNSLPVDINTRSNIKIEEDIAHPLKTSVIPETPQIVGDSTSSAQFPDSIGVPLATQSQTSSLSLSNGLGNNPDKENSPYIKVDPTLLTELKSTVTLEVLITATDMKEVRELLGVGNPDLEMEQKGNKLRLETSIFEIQNHMLPQIASLKSVISIQKYTLPTPPQIPEGMEDYMEFDSDIEPTMWNAVKYHWADEAWNLGFNGSGVKVAVLDTGVDFGHPDLNGTQARDENPTSPYYGWPLAFDSRSMNSYLSSGGQGFPSRDNWYSDTSATDTDGNGNGTLDNTGWNVTGIISQSGIYHTGQHPDTSLLLKLGNYANVLVVDENLPGVYDTVYIDLDDDMNFTDEKPCRKGDEVSVHDLNDDGTPDRSGGMIYFIADGTNPVPYSDIIASENGYSLPIPTNGTLVAFMLNDYTEGSAGNHGTLCASAITGQGVIASGRVTGTAPNAKIIAVGNIYYGGNSLDNYYFAVEGYDGIPGTGDEANIVSCSFGDSNVVQDGWDFNSRFVDNLTTYYAPNVTFAIASGNGGYGYGTVVSPGSSPGVITCGAALNKRIPEVVYWSNRGPNSVGQVDPDIVSVGVSAYGDQALNQKNNGNSAYQTWSGTSLATPVTAGIIALIYDAYYQANGEYPTSQLTREIIMSTADNLNYDPLVQGAGFSNATRATMVANNASGLLLSPSFWSAGSYKGSDYDAFAHILHPGESDNITISVSNRNQSNSMDVYISDYILSRTETHSVAIVANKTLEDSSIDRPDYFIPLNDSKNNISHIPNDTALLKVSGFMPYDEFDPDFDYSRENRFWITIYNWKDNNANGSYWNDTNNDSIVQPDEIEWGELTSICSSSISTNTQEARMHNPMSRIDDGLIVGVFHQYWAASPEITHLYVQSQCYNRTDWGWLSTNKTYLSVEAGGIATFNASISVPMSTPIGLYEGMIAINETTNETAMPVIVNVASNSPQFTFGGNTLSTDLYANDQVFGAVRWGWRYEGGDWRFYFTEIPDSFVVNPGTKVVADVKWDNYPTDIDVFILGGSVDSFSNEMPDRYGPYTMGINSASTNTHIGSGRFRFDTTTDGPQEIISADLSEGLNEIILHNVLYAGQSFSENVTGFIGTVNVTPCPWDVGLIEKMENLTGTQQFTLESSFNLSDISVEAYGVYPAMDYPNELVYQNTPSDKTTANWSKDFNVSGAEYIKVNISSQYTIDIDLYLLRDINGNGIPNWGSEQVASSTSPYADEEITINSPADGRYWVFVHGWNVPSSPSVFDCYIEAVYGNDITVTDVPVGNISAYEPAFFNASYILPPIAGEYRGVIIIGLTDISDTISVPFIAELESEKPTISNLVPSEGAWVTTSQPTISADYNDTGSGINVSRVFIYVNGRNQTDNATITTDGITLNPPSPISEGGNTVYLIVTDMFGNQNSTAWQFFVESKAPDILELIPPNGSWVTTTQPVVGALYNDSGSGINTSMVFIHVDFINWTSDSTITSDSIIIPSFLLVLTQGYHSAQVNVTDMFGNQNSTSWEFYVDSIKPTISDLKPPDEIWINNTQPEIGALYNDTGSGIDLSRVFIYIDGLNQTVNATITSDSLNLTPIIPLQEGNHTVYLIVTDIAGNQNSTTWQFLVDSKKPTISNLLPSDGAWINYTLPTISAEYEDPGSQINVSRVLFYVDGVNQTDNATVTSETINFTPLSSLIEGGHIVYLEVWDNYGYQNSTTWQFFVDSIKPNIFDLQPENGSWTTSNQPTIGAQYSGTGSDIDLSSVFIYVDGMNQTINAAITLTWIAYTPTSPITEGYHDAFLIVTDVAGNQNSTSWQFQVDSIKPVISDIQPSDYALLNYTQPTISSQYNDSGSGLDFSRILLFIDGLNQTDNATISLDWLTFTPPSPISEGIHTVYLTLTDFAGNQNSSTWQFQIDTIKPIITNLLPSNGSWINHTQPSISALYNDSNSGIDLSQVFIFIDGVNQTENTTITSDSIIFTPSSPLSEGIHTVYLVLSDMTGNRNSTTWQFYVDSLNPIADAGFDRTVYEDEIVNFDGSSCHDENEITNLTWNFGDGDFGYGLSPTHSYPNSGTYIVILTIWDVANNTDSDTQTVYVNNLAPNAEAGNDQIIDEGETAFFDGSDSTDTPSDIPSLIYTWYLGDGNVLTGVSVSHIFIDNGNYTVTLVVEDDNGYTDTDTVNITVNNVAPTAIAGGPYSGDEGSEVLFSGSASDPGDDIFIYEWDFDDSDGITYMDATGFDPVWTWPDDFSGSVYLRVTDDDGGVGTSSATVTINNVAPIVNSGGPYSKDEGDLIIFNGSAADAGSDTFTFEWDMDNDGLYDDASGQAPSWAWDDNGIFVIGLRVTDDDGGVGIDTTIVNIGNIPPTADAGGPYSGDEGSVISFTGTVTDPGITDTFTFYWDFDDGTGSSQQNPTHIFGDDDVYTVTLTVTDKDGGTDSNTTTVTISNVAPIANIGGPYSGSEGISISFEGSASDPGQDTFIYEWDFDDSDGLTYEDATGPNPSWLWSDDFSGTIYLRVTDDDGGVGTNLTTIVIKNTAPTSDVGGPYMGNEGSSITLSGSAMDSGSDTLTFDWDLDNDVLFDDATGLTPSWTWDDNGVYIIGLRVTDDDGGVSFDSTTVTINNVAPVAEANGPYDGNESSVIDFNGHGDDPGFDTLTYLWDFGDGELSTQQNPAHVYADNGVYLVSFTVTDDDGGTHTDTSTAIIYNMPPALETNEMTVNAKEDVPFSIKINATDAQDDSVTFTDNTDMFVIDPISGLIQFTPTNNDVGINQVTITVSDDDGATSTLRLLIDVENENDAPVLEKIGSQIAHEGELFQITVSASDPDSEDMLNFSGDTELFDIHPKTGVISFTPTNDQVGVKTVAITVTDSEGLTDWESVIFTIVNTNDAPLITDIPHQNAVVGEKFTYSVIASDVDDAVLIFSDDSDLFVIDSVTGTISFIPTKGDEGVHVITIMVTDSHGEKATETMELEIEEAPGVPEKETEPETDWITFILIILLIILIVLFLIHMIMHTRKKETERKVGEEPERKESEEEVFEVEEKGTKEEPVQGIKEDELLELIDKEFSTFEVEEDKD